MTENLSPAGHPDQAQPARQRGGLAILAMFLALAALCGSGWLWWQYLSETQGEASQLAAELSRQGQLLTKLDARSGDLQSKLSTLVTADPAPRLNKFEQAIGALQQSTGARKSLEDENAARIQSMHAEMASSWTRLAAAEARLTAVSARTIDSSAELDLAEVDYLLRLAQERLALFGDSRTADRALELADRHITAFDNPMYIGVQHEIASTRQKLSLVNLPDYQVLERKLERLQNAMGTFTFKGEAVPSEQAEQPEDSNWWVRIRNAFSGLVTVRRSFGGEKELPVLADQELIRQGAWLELEVARWAAVRRDQGVYAAALKRFSATLERWFEPSDQGRQEASINLRELLLLNVDPPMPDISAPWAALRALQGAPSQRDPGPPADSQPQSPGKGEAGAQTTDQSAGDAAR